MSYRDVLYTRYSRSFGERPSLPPGTLPEVFARIYPALPADRATPIADIGCGQGAWLSWVTSQGYTNLVGIDRSASELDRAQVPGVHFVNEDALAALNKFEGQFRLIHAKDLFEHFTKDEAVQFLLACCKALKVGGELWIYTFNAQGWFASVTRDGDFTHELAVTPTSLAQVLRATGFTVLSVRGCLPCPQTFGGLGRKLFFGGLEVVGRVLVSARHGRRVSDGKVDPDTTLPDLLARARRDEA